MAIDDPVGIAISQADEAISPNIPAELVKLGLSIAAAHALAKMPAIAQIVTGVFNLSMSTGRVERRLLVVLEEMNAQLKRIEKSIPNRDYYRSDEFYSHFHLVAEKLNTTHDEEKLRAFGDALANDGSEKFETDPKEEFFHVLRDLTSADLRTLKRGRPYGHLNSYEHNLGRLVGFGLVGEHLERKQAPRVPRFADSRRIGEALKELVEKPPERTYSISQFGFRFLEFVAAYGQPQVGDENTSGL